MPKGQPNVKYNSKGEVVKSPIKIDNAKKFYTGTIYTSSEGDKYIIEEYINDSNVIVRFLDQFNYSYQTYRSAAVAGNVKNPYHPQQYGGYVGDGNYGRKADERAYMVWRRMHERAAMGHSDYTEYAHYENITICKSWENFQNFAPWYYEEFKGLNPNFDYSLDKDILQWNIQDKIYSPETCSLVPKQLNNGMSSYKNSLCKYGLPTGVTQVGTKFRADIRSKQGKVDCNRSLFNTPEEAFEEYRKAKVQYLRDQADYYYNNGAIHKKIYDALYNIDIIPYSPEQSNVRDELADLRIEIQNKDKQLADSLLEIERLNKELEKFKRS